MMRRGAWAAGLGAWALLTLLALAAHPAEAAPQSTLSIQVTGGNAGNLGYNPASPQQGAVVLAGGKVTWTNVGDFVHTVTANDGSFDSGHMAPGATFERTFASGGTIGYYCTVHGSTVQAGSLKVDTAPVVAITSPASGGSVHGTFTIQGTASDADGETPALTVTLDGQPQVVIRDGQGWRVEAQAGSHDQQHAIVATATDADGASSTQSITVRVNAPPAAAFTFAPASPTSSQMVQFTDASTDDHTLATRLWNFGGGASSTAANPTHLFQPKGTYVVNLTVTDDHGVQASALQSIVVRNSAPVANFSAAPGVAGVNQSIALTDLTTDADNEAPVNWTWSLGDGRVAHTRNLTAAYAQPGNYTVNLTARDAEGAAHTASRGVQVVAFASAPPVLALQANVTAGQAPLAVRFTFSGTDPDGTVINWTLHFGDGQQATGLGAALAAGAQANHTYTSGGTFLAALEAVDDSGAIGRATVSVGVGAPVNQPPSAAFTVSPTSTPRKGQTVTFTDASSDPDPGDAPAAWAWDFGDGTTACCGDKVVNHAYPRAGAFTVRLTVNDTRGAQAHRALAIQVAGLAPQAQLGANATEGRAPFPVTFTPRATDGDGRVARWSLDFGDGSAPANGTGAPAGVVRHVYDRAGSFVAVLQAFDEDGLSNATDVALRIQPGAPQPVALPAGSLSVTPTGERLTYRFTATTAASGEATYRWLFGDNGTATGREVVYSYLAPGFYTVTLELVEGGVATARASTPLLASDEGTTPAVRIRSEVHSGAVRVAWTPDPRAAGYQVWRAVDGGRFEELGEVREGPYTDLDVRDGARLAYRVTFFGPAGEGRLQRLSQLDLVTEAFRLLGETHAVGLVDRDGDGVGDTRDAFPDDPTRSAGVDLAGPLLLGIAVAGAAGGGAAWWWRQRAAPPPPPARLTAVPGLLPEHAAILRGAGVQDVATLAAADPQDLARRTVLPLRQLGPWRTTAALMQVRGIGPEDAARLARAGVRGPEALAQMDPALVARMDPAFAERRARAWVEAARRHVQR